MSSNKSENGDERNASFGLPENVAHHKPGVEHVAPHKEGEDGGNHRFRPSEHKDIPQGTLAERIRKARKGE